MVFGQVPSGWLGIHNEICFKLVREILDEICFEVGLREMEKQGLAFQNIISLSLSLSLSLSISLSLSLSLSLFLSLFLSSFLSFFLSYPPLRTGLRDIAQSS